MSVEDERLLLEKSRLDFERKKFERTDAHEERKFKADKRARFWSQIATFIPILAIIAGFYANSRLESIKQINSNKATKLKIEREFVDKQLADLYYPIKMRLEKDTAVWQLSAQISTQNRATTDTSFSKYIENSVLIPNHEEIVDILAKNFGLIKNAEENYDVSALIKAINHYQRHVAAYKTLRTLGIYDRNPIQACDGCDFPKEFPKLIDERINSLETQRAALSKRQAQQGAQADLTCRHSSDHRNLETGALLG